MQELIEAAKAVIDNCDHLGLADIQRLRAAVERADRQEEKPWTKPIPTDFKEWWETYALNKYGMGPAYHAWSAGQQAERERIKEIVRKSIPEKMWVYRQAILEKIDATE